jgi:hypothetical protein
MTHCRDDGTHKIIQVIANCQLPIADWRLPLVDRLTLSDVSLLFAKFWFAQIGNRQLEIGNDFTSSFAPDL